LSSVQATVNRRFWSGMKEEKVGIGISIGGAPYPGFAGTSPKGEDLHH